MQVLNTLLEISVYSTILFCAIMLLKQTLKNRLSPMLHYAVWSLFVLRLLLPVTLQSPVQFFPLPAEPAAIAVPVTQPSGEQATSPQVATSETTAQAETAGFHFGGQTAPTQIGTLPETAKSPLSLATVLLAVWLLGVIVGVGYIVFLYLRLQKRIVKNAAKPAKRLRTLYQQVRQELGIRANVPLVCQYGLTSPGILFPACVLMPMDLLAVMDDEQVKNTLRHELVHYKRGDQIVSVLLSLLNAVYWFNPIVWIAVRQIRADMETVCDSVVVTRMSAKQKGDYATLILDLFSRSNYRQVVLGMAYGKSKSVVEKRIKGVFMSHKSRKSAVFVSLFMTLVLLIGCFTTACVPAKPPAKDIVTSGEGESLAENASVEQLASAPESTPVPAPDVVSPLAGTLGIPTPWTLDAWSTDHELQLIGNLTVTLPNVDKVPIATVTCRNITEDDLAKAVAAFFGPNVKFTYAPEDTKEYAEQWIAKNQEIYDNVVNGTSKNKVPSFIKSVKEQFEAYLELAKTAPSAAENKEIAPVFTEHMAVSGDPYMGFQGVAERDGTKYLVGASDTGRNDGIRIAEMFDDRYLNYSGSFRNMPEGISTTKEQAIALATGLAQTLDRDLSLNHVMAVGLFVQSGEENTWAHPWAWQCVFMRELNGVGTVYDSRNVGSDIDTNVLTGQVYEALEITVDDRGICNVHWVNPVTVDSVTNPSATLLPFSQIEQMIPDLVREKYDYDITRENGTHVLYLSRAELGMMRIGKPGAASYTMEPVWSFFIDFEEHPDYAAIPDLLRAMYDGDPVYWNSLTISAIDGRVIDRDRGY